MVLSVEDVVLEFEGLRALSGVSFAVEEGALTALVGPNGAGKTSLLNCMGGFYRPTRGQVTFHGSRLSGLAPHRVAAAASPASHDVVLEIDGVAKSYGSFHALNGVALKVRRGELVSIVGPNGAGKTSLVRCIADGQERTAGEIAVGGRSIGRSAPDVIVGLGVGRKFQGASVFGSLTVGECLKIAAWKGRLPSVWRQRRATS